MRKAILVVALAVMAGAASIVWANGLNQKLPKCSGQLCRNAGCSPDVLCVSGAHVKNCADVCRGK